MRWSQRGKRAGDPVDPQDYLARYPDQAAELGRLLGLEDAISMGICGPHPQATTGNSSSS